MTDDFWYDRPKEVRDKIGQSMTGTKNNWKPELDKLATTDGQIPIETAMLRDVAHTRASRRR